MLFSWKLDGFSVLSNLSGKKACLINVEVDEIEKMKRNEDCQDHAEDALLWLKKSIQLVKVKE